MKMTSPQLGDTVACNLTDLEFKTFLFLSFLLGLSVQPNKRIDKLINNKDKEINKSPKYFV